MGSTSVEADVVDEAPQLRQQQQRSQVGNADPITRTHKARSHDGAHTRILVNPRLLAHACPNASLARLCRQVTHWPGWACH